jgi:protein TonB
MAIVGAVLVLHALALWALQTGLLRRAVEVVVPAELLSQIIEPPAPKVEPPPPAPPPVRQPTQKSALPSLPPAPQPLAIADPTPAPNAPTGVTTPQPLAPPVAAPVAASTAPAPAAPAPVKVELPSTDAEYLNNPEPPYPPLSKRLGEQGKVVVRVLIGPDGLPQKAEVRQTSGFDRLDQTALATVMRWRYVPGKRGGVPEAMWFNVPINFVLK